MHEIVTRICDGKGVPEDIDRLETLAETIKEAALCGLGKSSPNPVLSTLKYFRHEYDAHVNEKRCPAGVCKALISFSIIDERCTGCRACALKCPQGCITGEKREVHTLDPEDCIKCGICRDVCRFDAVLVQ